MKPLLRSFDPPCLKPKRAKDNRPSAAKRGYGAAHRKLRTKTSRRPCADCGAKWKKDFHLDHDIPKRLGGSDDETNLKWRCHSCHSKKTAKKDGGFGRRRSRRDDRGATYRPGDSPAVDPADLQ